ncbi:MAG: hypothetical protein A3K09_06165 [Nitrospinae bacterium RIFCSPLOWO2_12_FULL_47_7]|nr:MAG: hypothetical protein A3K09_06165 [Nitrospinae bacterium RIFCSPLOWO2_12_FULL_47_7]
MAFFKWPLLSGSLQAGDEKKRPAINANLIAVASLMWLLINVDIIIFQFLFWFGLELLDAKSLFYLCQGFPWLTL